MDPITHKIAMAALRLVDLLESVEVDIKSDRESSIETILSANQAKNAIEELERLTGVGFKEFLKNHVRTQKTLAKNNSSH